MNFVYIFYLIVHNNVCGRKRHLADIFMGELFHLKLATRNKWLSLYKANWYKKTNYIYLSGLFDYIQENNFWSRRDLKKTILCFLTLSLSVVDSYFGDNSGANNDIDPNCPKNNHIDNFEEWKGKTFQGEKSGAVSPKASCKENARGFNLKSMRMMFLKWNVSVLLRVIAEIFSCTFIYLTT